MEDEEPKVHTHRHGLPDEIQGKLCQCQDCGVVHECVPEFDFFIRNGDLEKRLYCETCLMRDIFKDTDAAEDWSDRVIEVELEPGEKIESGDTIIVDEDEEEPDDADDGDPADWWKREKED